MRFCHGYRRYLSRSSSSGSDRAYKQTISCRAYREPSARWSICNAPCIFNDRQDGCRRCSLTELYATLAVETVDQGAPEPGRARADVSFTTTSKWLLSSSTGIPNREDCHLVIDQYGVDNIGKVDLRQEDAVLLRSRFLRAMEPQTGPSVVTSQQLSAVFGRRPSLRQTRPEEASSAPLLLLLLPSSALPMLMRTAILRGTEH